MNERLDNDEWIAVELAEALEDVRPHLEGVAGRAKGAFTWRTIDEDLLRAELTYESGLSLTPSALRDETANRVLMFQAEPASVEIEVLSDRVVGQLTPQTAGVVEVESEGDAVVTVPIDEFGFFIIEPVPSGVVRLRCTTPTTRLVTDWVRL